MSSEQQVNKIPVAQTALLVAIERIQETKREDAIHRDPFAEKLIGKEILDIHAKVHSAQVMPNRMFSLRAKVMDEIMISAPEKFNIKQIVNAACGVDTVAWRIRFPSDVTYFELDFPEMLEWKSNRLKDEKVQCNYKAVGIDLRDPQWPNKLVEAGFDKTKPSCWITAGFLMYLTPQSVNDFLDRVSSISAPGSIYTADILSKTLTSSPLWINGMGAFLAKMGSPVEFSTDEPEKLFAEHGFTKVVQELHFTDLAAKMKIDIFPKKMVENVDQHENVSANVKNPVLTVQKEK